MNLPGLRCQNCRSAELGEDTYVIRRFVTSEEELKGLTVQEKRWQVAFMLKTSYSHGRDEKSDIRLKNNLLIIIGMS